MKKHIYALILCLFISSWSVAQSINLTDKLAMDPTVKVGKLKNGLTYFIKKNVEPKNRAELRLVMKVGSILETDEQQGIAHFMEHMNFNGTKNFPKNELLNFLEKSGIKFGADLNAYTSFDETVYMLPVPTDTLAKFEKYLSVLADWSGNATLDHTEIDKERGVVLEEARLRKGAAQRVNEKLYPVLFRGSRYAERLPIGTDEVIQHAPYTQFEQFKNDWYRPNLQAVIAVGDFDPAEVEAMIIKQFGKFKNPKKQKTRTQYTVPLDGSTDAIVITDKEQPYSIVQIFYLQPEKKEITVENRREFMIRSLFNTMMSQRLQELTQKADPPFLGGGSSYGPFLAGLDALTVVAVAKGNEVEKAIITVLDENQRALQFGFTQGELDRAKLGYATMLDKQLAEKDKTSSAQYVNELIQVFLKDVPMTNIMDDKSIADQYLNLITLDQVNAFVKQIITKENRVASLIGPEKEKDNLPTVQRIKELLDNTGTKVEAYVDEAVAGSLVDKMPKPGKVVSETKIPELGITELVLSNGVKIKLLPTDFKNDEIIFSGTSWGGNSLYPDSESDNASFSSLVAGQSGNGNLTNTQLTKFLSGKVARVNASVGSISEVISGSSTVKDLETALQMMYNKFTNNNLDKATVTGVIGNQTTYLKNMEAIPTPEKVYSDTLQSVVSNYHVRAKPMTSDRFSKLNPERSMQIFNERFADPADFDFTFVGNFDVEKIKPLLATYLGGIPSTNKKENFVNLGIKPPKGVVTKIVKKGTEDKASVTLILSGDYVANTHEESQLDALGEILQIKITEKLREEEGGAYSPYAFVSYSRFPASTYQVRIGFGCAPANVNKLIEAALAEVKTLKDNGATKTDIEKYVSNEKLNLETNLKKNGYWLSAISEKTKNGEDLKSILTAKDELDSISVQSTKAAAQKYFTGENLIKVILLPEDK